MVRLEESDGRFLAHQVWRLEKGCHFRRYSAQQFRLRGRSTREKVRKASIHDETASSFYWDPILKHDLEAVRIQVMLMINELILFKVYLPFQAVKKLGKFFKKRTKCFVKVNYQELSGESNEKV